MGRNLVMQQNLSGETPYTVSKVRWCCVRARCRGLSDGARLWEGEREMAPEEQGAMS